MSFWQQLQRWVPYNPDSTHEQLKEGEEEEVEAMQGLDVLLSLPELDPIQREYWVMPQNETLSY